MELVAHEDRTGGLIGSEVAGDAHPEFMGRLLVLDGDIQNIVDKEGEELCPHRVVLLP